MKEVLSPRWTDFDLQSGNPFFQNTPLGVKRTGFDLPAGQAFTSNQTSSVPLSSYSDPTSSTPNYASDRIPQNAEMSVVYTGPAQSDCQIQLIDRSINPRTSIPVKKDRPRLNPIVPGTSTSRKQGEKATGVLCLPGNLPLKATVSGWSQYSQLEHQIDNTRWTDKSLLMCPVIGHTLQVNNDPGGPDQGVPGKFDASHVEKQLLAYVYFNHVFRHAEPPGRGPDEMDWVQTFEDLFTQEPKVEKSIRIYVDRPHVCKSCAMCVSIFQQVTGISVAAYVRGQTWIS